jgi:hypothetical protein
LKPSEPVESGSPDIAKNYMKSLPESKEVCIFASLKNEENNPIKKQSRCT